MCGIIGFAGDNTAKNRDLIVKLMLQLSLRGTHATGVIYQSEEWGLETVIHPVPAELFFDLVSIHELFPNHLMPIRLIGHTRYSTSDIKWNQPLMRDGLGLVMNGVISQESPEKWPASDFLEYETGNDAEIALMHSLSGMRGQIPGSFAVCELDQTDLFVYRNTDRPLWFGRGADFSCVVSTQDALKRCRVGNIKQVMAGRVFQLHTPGTVADLTQDFPVLRVTEQTFELSRDDQQAMELLYGDLLGTTDGSELLQ